MALQVMQKVFALLLVKFRKLGATIIFANFSKVIIDTGKSDLSATKAYYDSLIKTLQSRDLFKWIELEQLQFWHSLLFMDQYNYGGIQARINSESLENISEPRNRSVHDLSQVDIVSCWNIAEYLPKATQDHFILIVSKFMYIPWKYMQQQATVRASLRDSNLCTPSITATGAEAFDTHITEYLKEQGASKSNADQHISYDIHGGDATLEFIKLVCAVLALDQNV